MEKWKNVIGYDGIYQVSDAGSVRKTSGKKLISSYDSHGYKVVTLFKDGSRRSFKVHRLVASAFIPNPQGKQQINHINSVRHDNRVSNLEWVSPHENSKHAFLFGKGKIAQKAATEAAAKKNKRPIVMDGCDIFPSVKDAAKAAGCAPYDVSHVLRGDQRTARGHRFSYA